MASGELLQFFGRPFVKRSPYAIGPSSSCLSCLYVTLVHCSQTAGWIKISLGREIGLGPGEFVLWGPSPPKRGHSSPPHTFGPSIVAKRSPISATAELLLDRYALCPTKRKTPVFLPGTLPNIVQFPKFFTCRLRIKFAVKTIIHHISHVLLHYVVNISVKKLSTV